MNAQDMITKLFLRYTDEFGILPEGISALYLFVLNFLAIRIPCGSHQSIHDILNIFSNFRMTDVTFPILCLFVSINELKSII